MSYTFRLSVVRVECLNEQIWEWGKDEMHMLAYGVTRRGVPFATGYRDLGSYGTGDANQGGFPILLHQTELPDDGLDGVLFLWLVEEDGGGVRAAAAALDAAFLADYATHADTFLMRGFPRDCVPFAAFYKALVFHAPRVQEASTDGRDDELYAPNDFYMRYAPTGPASTQSVQEFSFTNSKQLGVYSVFLRASWKRVPLVLG